MSVMDNCVIVSQLLLQKGMCGGGGGGFVVQRDRHDMTMMMVMSRCATQCKKCNYRWWWIYLFFDNHTHSNLVREKMLLNFFKDDTLACLI